MKFIYRLKYAIDSPDSPPLFQEKPVIEGPPIETGGDKGEDKKEVEVKGDEGDVGSIGFGDIGGDMGGSGDSGEEPPAMTPTQPVEIDPQEALDVKSRESIQKEIKRLKDMDEAHEPEDIRKELEDEGWEYQRLYDLYPNENELDDLIKNSSKRRINRISRIMNERNIHNK